MKSADDAGRADGKVHAAFMPSLHLENVGADKGISPARLGLEVVGSPTGEGLKTRLSERLNDEQLQKYVIWQEKLLERMPFLIEKRG